MGCGSSASGDSSSKSHPEDHEAFHSAYEIGTLLSDGGFTQIRQVKPRRGSAPELAAKILNLEAKLKTDRNLNALMTEDKLWRSVNMHPNIVQLHESYMDNKQRKVACFTMELCSCPLLQSKMLAAGGEIAFANLARSALMGLLHMHSQNIVHRNIQPETLLVSAADELSLKICDFSSAAKLPAGGLLGTAGPVLFNSPEMLSGNTYGEETDVWSLGVSFYLAMLGDLPYRPYREMTWKGFRQAIYDEIGAIPKFKPVQAGLPQLSPPANEFLQCLLKRARNQRCTAQKALQKQFLVPSTSVASTSLERTLRRARRLLKETRVLKVQRDEMAQEDLNKRLRSLQTAFGGYGAAFDELAFKEDSCSVLCSDIRRISTCSSTSSMASSESTRLPDESSLESLRWPHEQPRGKYEAQSPGLESFSETSPRPPNRGDEWDGDVGDVGDAGVGHARGLVPGCPGKLPERFESPFPLSSESQDGGRELESCTSLVFSF